MHENAIDCTPSPYFFSKDRMDAEFRRAIRAVLAERGADQVGTHSVREMRELCQAHTHVEIKANKRAFARWLHVEYERCCASSDDRSRESLRSALRRMHKPLPKRTNDAIELAALRNRVAKFTGSSVLKRGWYASYLKRKDMEGLDTANVLARRLRACKSVKCADQADEAMSDSIPPESDADDSTFLSTPIVAT